MATSENMDKTNRLQKLSGSDYEIRDGQPDITDWDVKDSEGKKMGDVDDLIFDVQSHKVRYIVLDTDDNDLNLDDRKVLVPIGLAQLHEKDDDVLLPGITAAQLKSLPEYDDETITPEVESSIRTAFAGLGAAGVAGAYTNKGKEDDFYAHEHFNEDNLYKRREAPENTNVIPVVEENLQVGKEVIEKGGARVRSRIVEQPVEENVNLREEHVNIERNEVNRPATEADFARVKEDTVELTERAEVPVVNKEARVVEEIKLSKEVTERDETIQDTIRKTEVDIENLGRDERQQTRQDRDDIA